MAPEIAQTLMHTPRPVELTKEVFLQKDLEEEKKDELPKQPRCFDRVSKILDELTSIKLDPDCTTGQGFLSNAEGNIRMYLALFE